MKSLFLPALVILALAPAGAAQRLIAVDSSRALSKVNMQTGAKTAIGTVSVNASTAAGLALDTSTNTVYLTSTGNDSLFTLDVATGTATLVGAYGDAAIVMHGLEYDLVTNTLYGASSHNGGLYSIDRTTGVATLIGLTGLTSFVNLCYVLPTNTMYATINGATPQTLDSFYSIDVTTGAATFIGTYAPAATNINGLAYDADNDVIYAVDNSTDNLYTMDRVTGAANLVGSMGSGNLLGLVWLPGTGTYAQFGVGCAGTLGVPGNQIVAWPNIDHTMSINVTNLPFDAAVFLTGFSNTTSPLGPLPIDLTPVGAPGCFGRVSPDMVDLIFGAPGSQVATFNIAIPDNAAFLGLNFYTQGLSFDTVNAFGLVAGDAAAGVVGQ